jgi:polyhydroxyalkanoate synthesis regulator phasin
VSEERKLILQMVAEGKITPDEADKLLQALDESERAAHSAAAERAQQAATGAGLGLENLGAVIEKAVGESMRALEGTLRDLELDLERRTNDPAREQLVASIEEKMRRTAERAVERARQADERTRRIAERAEERAREIARRAEEQARRFEARAEAHANRWALGVAHFSDELRNGARIFKSGICIDKVSVEGSKSFTAPAQPGDQFLLENRVGNVRVEFYDGDAMEVNVHSVIWGEDEADAKLRADAFHMDLVRRGSDVVMEVLRPTITATGFISIKESRLDYVVKLPQGMNMSVRCKAGDLVVVGAERVGQWNLLTKVGDVDVKVAPTAGFIYDLSTNVGDVRLTVANDQPNVETKEPLKKGAYRVGRVGDGAGRIEVSIKTGDIRIIN